MLTTSATATIRPGSPLMGLCANDHSAALGCAVSRCGAWSVVGLVAMAVYSLWKRDFPDRPLTAIVEHIELISQQRAVDWIIEPDHQLRHASPVVAAGLGELDVEQVAALVAEVASGGAPAQNKCVPLA